VAVNGIILVAYGEKYLTELGPCRARIEAVWPDVAIHVFQSEQETDPHMLCKIDSILASPFERTIFMDCDCYLVEPIPELFEMLDHFDIAMPQENYRELYSIDVPGCFREYNAGLIAWKGCDDLFTDWRRRFLQDNATRQQDRMPRWFPCQPSLREALYYSGARLATLPVEYNWRGIGYVKTAVKIVHRHGGAEREAIRINAKIGRIRQ
jgi:hypothetical protein